MARRFARRRRARVAWMPVFGGSRLPEDAASPFPGIEFQLTVDDAAPNGAVFWDAVPLTFDITEGASEAQGDPTAKTLRDIVQGNEWRLRRIVGKAFITALNISNSSFSTAADVALGFIVCKTYDDGQVLTDFNEVNPLSQDSMEDPWVWRRRWILAPNGLIVPTAPLTADISVMPQYWGYPQTTAGYGSVMDGPHIDAKSNRTIHRSERLMCVLAARRYNPFGANQESLNGFTLQAMIDYRLVGSLKSQQYGNRGNMSR